MMYLMMNNKLFILDILWKMFLLSTSCVSGSLNISDETTTSATTIPTTTTTTTTATTTPSFSILPKTPPSPPLQVTLCLCGAGEVIDRDTGECQPWVNGTTTVPMESRLTGPGYIPVDTKEMSVTVNEANCANREIELPEDEFVVRSRGDLRVMKGKLRGLRVTKYCIHHYRGHGGETGQVKVIARGCVPIPDVPRCCPPGEHMRNSNCVPAAKSTTPQPFNPPLSTGPHGRKDLPGAPFPWPEQEEHVYRPSCPPNNVIKRVKLGGKTAYLAALDPQGVFMSRQKQGPGRQNYPPQQYCVDVPGYDGTYFAYFCQRDLDAYCKDNLCTRKCCPNGLALDTTTKGCVPTATPFKPHATDHNIKQETITGFPECEQFSEITNFTLLQDGTIMYETYTYRLSEFCMDNFLTEDYAELKALKCTKEDSTWINIKSKCLGLSCAFLALLLLLHAWVPKLMDDNGQYQCFHAASLLVGISISLILRVMPPDNRNLCMFFAFAMQFAILSAFFWINVMVFDMWRIFRYVLRTNLDPVPSKTAGIYKIYACGGPLLITVVTMIVQFVAPVDGSVPWLVHPHVGEGSCWLKSVKEQLAYFYGPTVVLLLLNIIFIGLTYHYIRIIRGIQKSTNDPNESTEEYAESTNKSDFIAAYWKQFILLVLVAGSWLAAFLSSILPQENWMVTDILNNLQGVFVFFVFLTERKKRFFLKEQLPKLLKIIITLNDQTYAARTDINNQNRMLTKKISPSSLPIVSKGVSNSSLSHNESEASTTTPSIGITELSSTSKQL